MGWAQFTKTFLAENCLIYPELHRKLFINPYPLHRVGDGSQFTYRWFAVICMICQDLPATHCCHWMGDQFTKKFLETAWNLQISRRNSFFASPHSEHPQSHITDWANSKRPPVSLNDPKSSLLLGYCVLLLCRRFVLLHFYVTFGASWIPQVSCVMRQGNIHECYEYQVNKDVSSNFWHLHTAFCVGNMYDACIGNKNRDAHECFQAHLWL